MSRFSNGLGVLRSGVCQVVTAAFNRRSTLRQSRIPTRGIRRAYEVAVGLFDWARWANRARRGEV